MCSQLLWTTMTVSFANVTGQMLGRLGHRVLAAEIGAGALELATKAERLDLLTVVVMPWINGRELYERLVAGNLELVVVYVSGYTDNVVLSKSVIGPGVTLVRKPFTEDELGVTIQNVMRARERTGQHSPLPRCMQ
jgi:DNA-binding NtrC family response regulator